MDLDDDGNDIDMNLETGSDRGSPQMSKRTQLSKILLGHQLH